MALVRRLVLALVTGLFWVVPLRAQESSGAVTGKVSRKQGRSFRRFGSLRLTLRKGRNALTVTRVSSGKRLTAGSYRLALTFSDGISNLTTGKTLNFTISR